MAFSRRKRETKRVAVVVPAYREERLLAKTLRTMPTFVDRIIVVDDASPDRTFEVAREVAAEDERLEIIRLGFNRGVGGAIVRGYERAAEMGADAVAVMAGDGQMDPEDLEAVVRPVLEGRADYVKGDRLSHSERRQMPPMRRLGTFLLARLTGAIAGLDDLRDSQCGYTAISGEMLRQLDLQSVYTRYGYPNDMLMRLSELGARVEQPTVRPIYGDEESGFTAWNVALPIGGVLLRGLGRQLGWSA